MTWTLTDNIEVYADTVTRLLRSEPERYTVMITVLATLVRHGPSAFGDAPPVLASWVPDAGDTVRAAAFQTPPHPLHLTSLPGDSAGSLAVTLAAASGVSLTEVHAAEPDAAAFAAAWSAAAGQTFRVQERHRLYRLGQLATPDPMPEGTAKVATAADASLVRSWAVAFGVETGQHGASASMLDETLQSGLLLLWEVAGEPVAMASRTQTIAGVARIGRVYTPPASRNRGYGGAVTFSLTRLAIEQGASSVILFTDLANPVSNSVYLKLGYRPVEDMVLLGRAGNGHA